MSSPPEGERPGGDEPFEGIPPDEIDGDTPAREHPELEPEFVEALRAAENGEADEPEPEPKPEPEPELEPELEIEPPEETEPALGGSAAPGEQPTAEHPAPPPPEEEPEAEEGSEEGEPTSAPVAAETVEFSPAEVAEAQDETKEEAEQEEGSEAEDEAEAESEGNGAPRRTVVIEGGPAPPTAFQKPPPDGDSEPAPKRKRLWLRFLLGSVLIIATMAGATAASALYFLGDVADDLGGLPGVKKQLLPPQSGEPENILILGSDKRASEPGTKGLSDTTILLRLDPNNNAIALMSIPRDLKTYIPGVGTTKFNAAYAYGGPKLTLRVVKRITGHLPINHVVNVDFLGFARAVNAIGCVYVDVDRRYYHSNVGLPPSLQYSEIDIQPGYQRLCGKDALAYVRYRHTDTDLVRSARQQDFLREARQQVPAEDLFITKRKQLLSIFTNYTTSDIDNGETLLQVLKLFVASRNAPIKEIHFPGILHPSYVTASKSAVAGAVKNFLGIEASGGPRGVLGVPQNSGKTGIAPEERKRAKAKKKARKQQEKATPTPTKGNDGLVDAGQFSHDLAAKVARHTLRSFPVFYPRRLPSGAIYVQVPRVYHLPNTDHKPVGAYKMVLQLPQGDYFGFEGLHDWPDPPILSDPNETRTIAGREYDIYLDGDRVRMIAWHQGDNSYWVSNSLLQTLSNDQMLGIARAIAKLPGERTKKHKAGKQGKGGNG